MANRFPLVVDTSDGNKLKEIPVGDSLDLTNSGIANLTDLSVAGALSSSTLSTTGNVSLGGTLNVTGATTLSSLATVSMTLNGATMAVPVQSNWTETDVASLAYIQNKPTSFTPSSINDIPDVDTVGANNGDILIYDGFQWQAEENTGGLDGPNIKLLFSATTNTPSGVGSLTYNNSSGNFSYTPPNAVRPGDNLSVLVNDSNFIDATYLSTNDFTQATDILGFGRITSTVVSGQAQLTFDESGLLTVESDTLATVVARGASTADSIEADAFNQAPTSTSTNTLKDVSIETLAILTSITSTNGTLTYTNGNITATNGNITAGGNLSGNEISATTDISTPKLKNSSGTLQLEANSSNAVEITNGVLNFTGVIPGSPSPGDLWATDLGVYFRLTDDGSGGGTDKTIILGGPGTSVAGGPGMIIPQFEQADAPSSPSEGEMYFDLSSTKARMWDGSQWNDLW